jgi:hypothetical protein
MIQKLYPYQREVAAAVLESVFEHKGLTFSVEIARQGGKNELSAQLELLLLTLFMDAPQNIVKCAPTFKPQAVISMMRLKERLNDAGFGGIWTSEMGYIIRLGEARVIFLSAEEGANVVGNTAHLLLETDEAQDVSKERYAKAFRPMGATTNCTSILYGTAWDDATLLEEVKQQNIELEKKDGVKRHFEYGWQEVSKFNPSYLAYVEGERQRLGENHPLFLTQYCLKPLHGGGGFFNFQQLALLQGDHARLSHPEEGRVYVAGIDLGGESEVAADAMLRSLRPKQDSTIITIGEIDFIESNSGNRPRIKIVQHYAFTGRNHAELYPELVAILRDIWRCRRIVIDATGVGQPVYSFLRKALGARLLPFVFTATSKSELAFNLLAAVNSDGLKLYRGDGSPEYKEFRYEMERAKSAYRPGRTMNFFVDEVDGHDDYLMSLALTVEAGRKYEPREARGA